MAPNTDVLRRDERERFKRHIARARRCLDEASAAEDREPELIGPRDALEEMLSAVSILGRQLPWVWD